jgi:hypothetical protein
MNLTILNKSNTFDRKGKPPVINIDLEGRINFSVEAVKLLELQHNDTINFAFDVSDPGIVYFYHAEDGFHLSGQKTLTGQTRLSVYCRPLADRLVAFLRIKSNASYKIKNETLLIEGGVKAWFFGWE